MRSVPGKVVLITGSSSGIGRALAYEYAQRKARVVITGRRLDRLQSLAMELTSQGCSALPLHCHVRRDEDLQRAVAETVARYGKLDVVIANAGFGVVGSFAELSVDDYRAQFETNIFGVIRTAYAALPELRKSKGSLAIMSSVSGYVASPGVSAYCMSKFALQAFAHSLWYELAAEGVAVTSICPGFVRSEIRQVDNQGRWHPEAPDAIPSWLVMPTATAAHQIVHAIEKRRYEVIITAHGKLLVWIQRHFPGLIHFAVGRVKARSYRPQLSTYADPEDGRKNRVPSGRPMLLQ
jgi:short-subunit dehydrogenase